MLDVVVGFVPGAVAVVAAYVIYVAATKDVPAAYALVKGWWTKASSELATIKRDVAALEQRVAKLEGALAGANAPAPAPAPAPTGSATATAA